MSERWLPVPGFEDRYEISDFGRLRSLFTRRTGLFHAGRLRHPGSDQDGYKITTLFRADGTVRQVKIHRLVLEAFVGPCPPGHQCRHLNGDPSDNRLENLCWGTVRQNHRDKVAHGTTSRGLRNVKAKLRDDDVRQIRRMLKDGDDPLVVAERFGVSRSSVYHIRNGHTWAWLNDASPAG